MLAMNSRAATLAALGLLVSCIVGCIASAAGPQEVLVPVSGTVMLDGEPVEGAIINFIPTGANDARQGSGKSDEEGHFVISNYQKKAGLPEGPYVVTFSLWLTPEGTLPPSDQPPASSRAMDVIPPQWKNAAKAGPHNQVTVREDGENEFVFKITKNVTTPGLGQRR